MEQLKEIFDLYDKSYKNEEITSYQLKNMLSDTNIILYGAGNAGIGVIYGFRKIGLEPLMWLDGNPNKWGTDFEGLNICNPENYAPKQNDLVVVCINTDGKEYCKSLDESLRIEGHSGVYKKLRSLGYEKIVDYSQFCRCYELYDNNPYLLPSVADVRCILNHKDDIFDAYELLSDELSKETFRTVFEFFLIDRKTKIPTMPDCERYFAPDIMRLTENEYFVDCGAFDGMYLDRMLKYTNGSFAKYMAIDCDELNFKKLRTKYEAMSSEFKQKTELYNVALSNRKETQNFYSLNGPGSFVSHTGTKTVNCDSLDNLLPNEKITIIKMNLEDSELPTLDGARETIIRNMPVLSISNYYKTENIWKILLKIKNLSPDYNCYMRSYMNHLSLVAYGIPKLKHEIGRG